jgi:hypothetical protein
LIANLQIEVSEERICEPEKTFRYVSNSNHYPGFKKDQTKQQVTRKAPGEPLAGHQLLPHQL